MTADERRLPITVGSADSRTAAGFALARGPEPIDAVYTEVPARQLRDYLRVLSRHRWLAAACFVGVVALTVLHTWMTQRQYTASARLRVARSSPIRLALKDNVLNLDETERILNGASSFVSTQVEALKSRDLGERVFNRYRLDANAAFLHPGRERLGLAAIAAELPATLRPRNLDASTAAPPAAIAEAPPSEARLLDRYMAYLAVEDVRGTDLIDVRFTTPDPTLSALLAAAHVGAYLDANQDAQLATDSRAMRFLGQQLEQSRERLVKAEAAVSQFASAYPNVAVSQEHELIGRQIGELSSLVTGAEGERVAAESRYKSLARASDQPLEHLLNGNPAIEKLRLALLDIETQRAALKLRLGPNHSQMAELRRQAAEIRLQLANEVTQEVEAARARFNAARQHEDDMRRKLAKLERTAIELRNLGGQYQILKGDLESTRSLHDSLLRQSAETAVHSELDASTVRIIERPDVPHRASRPRVAVNMALGLLGGLMGAVLAVFLRESLDSGVKSSDDLEGLLQLPTLALVPHFALSRNAVPRLAHAAGNGNGNGGDPPRRLTWIGKQTPRNGRDLVMLHEPWSPAAESYRHLRTAVLFSTPPQAPKAILVTSAGVGEGKTVTAANLAVAIADAGARVALLDVDLRDPLCHRLLGVESDRGLSTLLRGRDRLEDVIIQLDAPRLSFLPAGPVPPNPAELVGSQRMAALMRQLRGEFDFVILDSPPVLPVTDALLLAHLADAVVFVMNGQKSSPRDLVRRARDQLVQVGGNVIGVVVNKVGLHWGSAYVYDGYESYRGAAIVAAEEHAV